jgi:predicted  nucleic acid-binding Zn-ribbon protein
MSGYNIKAIDAELECLNERIAKRNATIASQAAQIERLREVMQRLEQDAKDYEEAWFNHGCDAKDAIRFVAEVSNVLLAALQPKEGE